MTLRFLPSLLLGSSLAMPAVMFGQSITVDLDSINPSSYALVDGHSGDSSFTNDLVGGLELTVTSQSGSTYPSSFEAFCVELAQNINLPSTGDQYTIVSAADASSGVGTGLGANIPLSGIGANRANNLEILYAHVFGAAYDPTVTLNTADKTEAFQLAVWKLSQDDGFDLKDAGNANTGFWITSVGGSMANSTVDEAQTLLNWVAANPGATKMDLVALHSGSLQDLLVPADGEFAAIPEAANYAQILGASVLVFALLRRRRTRRYAST